MEESEHRGALSDQTEQVDAMGGVTGDRTMGPGLHHQNTVSRAQSHFRFTGWSSHTAHWAALLPTDSPPLAPMLDIAQSGPSTPFCSWGK